MMYNKIFELLEYRAKENKDFVFIQEYLTKNDYTYGDLYGQAVEYSNVMKKAGLKENDRVGLLMTNGAEFFISYFAILMASGVVIPLNIHFGESEINYIIDDSNLKYIICKNESVIKKKNIEMKAVIELSKQCKLITLEEREEFCDNEFLIPNTAMIMYTSGSTGKSKGVMLTHENCLNGMKNVCEAHRLSTSDRVLCILPWFHINGLVYTMLAPLLANHTIVVAGKFNRKQFWEQIDTYQVTWFSAVPSIYAQLVEMDEQKIHKSLRFARSASSALSPALLEKFQNKFHTIIIEAYGATEGGGQLTSNPQPPECQKIGSVGKAYGLKIKIINEQGKECVVGENGEVCFNGKSVSKGYYKKLEETEKTFLNGWFKSGDVGYLDADGYLYLTGRIKELINREGEKISPQEIDDVLYRFPGMSMVACVGVPDKNVGEEVVAFCVLEKGIDVKPIEIKSFCKKYLADFKIPKEIFFVEELPLGCNGKVQRLKLLDVYKMMKKEKTYEVKKIL